MKRNPKYAQLRQECIESGAFLRLIGTLNIVDLEKIGVDPNCVTGQFWRKRMDEVITLAQQYNFHIITGYNSGLICNRFEPNGDFFYLGNGNPDPNLKDFRPPPPYDILIGLMREMIREILERDRKH